MRKIDTLNKKKSQQGQYEELRSLTIDNKSCLFLAITIKTS